MRLRQMTTLGAGVVGLLWLGACEPTAPPPPPSPSLMIISDSASGSIPNPRVALRSSITIATGAVAAQQTAETDVAYVSLPPASYPDGALALIHVAHITGSMSVPMIAGGLDPVAVPATTGDSVGVEILDSRGALVALTGRPVPPRRRPRVVRTIPPRGKTDVAVNAAIVVVFSEPVDPGSLSTSVQLFRGTARVAGTARVLDDMTAAVSFQPSQPLSGNTSYVLVVTQDVRDLDGDALEAAESIEFVTEPVVTGRIAFVREADHSVNGGIYVMKPDGSGITPLAVTTADVQNGFPAWSPDGRRIAFAGIRGEGFYTPPPTLGWEVYAMNADGSGVVRLTQGFMNPVQLTWSPVGDRISFTGINQESACSVGGFCYAAGWIYSIAPDGSGLTRVLSEEVTDSILVYHWFPDWSPDGSRLAFTRIRGRETSSGDVVDDTAHIYVANGDGTAATKLAVGSLPAWSPDGSMIAFVRWPAGEYCVGGEIYLMNADGSDQRALTAGAEPLTESRLSWSPDGTKIAFASTRPGTNRCLGNALYDIHVVNVDGSGMTRLTDTGRDHNPAWSRRE